MYQRFLFMVMSALALTACQPKQSLETSVLSKICGRPECMDYDKAGLKNSKQTWQRHLDGLNIGADTAAIQAWQEKHQVELSYYQGRYFTSRLPNGYFPVKNQGTACNAFFLTLEILVDKQGKVAEKAVKSMGSCL